MENRGAKEEEELPIMHCYPGTSTVIISGVFCLLTPAGPSTCLSPLVIQLVCHHLLEALLDFFHPPHAPPSTCTDLHHYLNDGPIIPLLSSRLFSWEFEAPTLASSFYLGGPLRRINQTDILFLVVCGQWSLFSKTLLNCYL